MRRVRVTVCLVFLASCILFILHMVKTRQLEDHTPPVITCQEDTVSVSVNADDAELLQGVTAKDDKDGDITDSIRVSSMSHFIEKGKRTVTYIVFDRANQAGTAQRTLVYTDYTSPKIYLSEPLRYALSDTSRANLSQVLTAEDCLDGDLTNQIRISLSDEFYSSNAPGDYDVTVQVSNSAGDVCAIPLQVTTVDTGSREESQKYYPVLSDYIVYTPVGQELSLSSYVTGVKRGGSVYSFEEDGDYLEMTKSDIKIDDSAVDYSRAGTYPVEYSYTLTSMNEEGEPEDTGVSAVTRLYVVVEE